MVYCQTKKFYQNHRYYVKSTNHEHHGKDINKNVESDDCNQVITKEEMGITTNLKGEINRFWCCSSFLLNLFLEISLNYIDENDKEIEIDQKDIAWEVNKKIKFKKLQGDKIKKQWIDKTDEYFIVWMSSLPNFRIL